MADFLNIAAEPITLNLVTVHLQMYLYLEVVRNWMTNYLFNMDQTPIWMNGFWEDTITFLQNQSLDYSNSDLEDVIFLVKRIKLF